MATKYVLAMSIILFWLVLPIPLMLMGVGGFDELSTLDQKRATEPTTITVIMDLGNYLAVYFKTMFFLIPNANAYIMRFVNFLQLMSGLLILVMIRGN